MCERCAAVTAGRMQLARRSILKFATGAAAGLAIAPQAFAANAKAPPKPENVVSPDAALHRLMQGNARYVEGESGRHDFRHEREALSKGQNPFAAILSCADSRIAPEYCFDTARGDLFVCRVAGNFASDEMIASLEYAVQVLNTPLIMVLGHGACGAVDATIKSMKDGTTLPGHLPSLVAAIRPAVEAVQSSARRFAGKRDPPQCHAQRRKTEIGRADPEIVRGRQEDPHSRRHLRAQNRARGTFELTGPDRRGAARTLAAHGAQAESGVGAELVRRFPAYACRRTARAVAGGHPADRARTRQPKSAE